MLVEQENKADLLRARDIDLKALSVINCQLDTVEDMQLVVTGSYAIEALTGNLLNHADIDVNIFTPDPSSNIPKLTSILEGISTPGLKLQFFRKVKNILEYNVLSERADSRRLEMQFVNVVPIGQSGLDFRLAENGIIPTVLAPLKDSIGRERLFRVKSLPYSIATWAIRISGVAKTPKREVRESDLEYFKMLLSNSFRKEDVLVAISQHPQMPANRLGSEVLGQAVNIAYSKAKVEEGTSF
jgi:hypothetical protein